MSVPEYSRETGVVLVLQLDRPTYSCGACEQETDEELLGIPMYDGQVLPNEWDGEWAGFPACRRCYNWQQTLAEPTDPPAEPPGGASA